MILNELTLRNFCVYQGEHVFDLAPAQRRGKAGPIVLFGGINGGGKTTLLDAVQLVLFGMRAKCSKRNDRAYDVFLRDSIHHGVDPSNGAGIGLTFRYGAEGKDSMYEVTRSWSEVRGRIREKVQVRRDGQIDGWLSENWNQSVEDLLPQGIAQLCFFDAEKVRFLADDESTSQALGGAIKSLLGLDLVERLIADVVVLEGRIAKRAGSSDELAEVEQLEKRLGDTQTEIERLVQDRAEVENLRQAAERVLHAAEDKFAKIGGQHWEHRQDRQRRLAEVDRNIQAAEEQLVELAATELPLALVPGLLQAVAERSHAEQRAVENAIVSDLLVERDSALLNRLRELNGAGEFIDAVQQFLDQDRQQRAQVQGSEARLRLSDGARSLLQHLRTRGIEQQRIQAAVWLEKLEANRREHEDLQRGIAATPEETSIRDVAEQLKVASKELAGSEQQIGRLDKLLDTLRGERAEVESRQAKLRRKVVDEQIAGEEYGRVANMLVRTQETMREFLRRATAAKIDRLSALVTESFTYLLRKKTLVQRVEIEPATFAITLYDSDGRAIPKQRLSEGEKQIFAVSVLWGLSRASARPLPAIIDTPMARLDAEHRQHLVTRYFPNASHQVIVLSTDTEVDQQCFYDLQPYIARAYHLDYDDQRKATTPRAGYFWDASENEALKETNR
ncbi:MAG: DNA sulfur modification protein DndD [Planctomycetia bacterium]|nr:DNA sulfur modification protein DndD [Planctomycetia bacterium]